MTLPNPYLADSRSQCAIWALGTIQDISIYYTTQVAPSGVETLRENAKSPKSELGAFLTKSPKSRKTQVPESILTGGPKN